MQIFVFDPLIAAEKVRHVQFLRHLEAGGPLTVEQLRLFAGQWWHTVRGHKLALLHLPMTLFDFDAGYLSRVTHEIAEEFGGGDVAQSHDILLKTFVDWIGADLANSDATPEVKAFSEFALKVWSDVASPWKAIGFHVTLEYIAGMTHGILAAALIRSNVPDEPRRYFDLHVGAEIDHATAARLALQDVLERRRTDPRAHEEIYAGQQLAVHACEVLFIGLGRVILSR